MYVLPYDFGEKDFAGLAHSSDYAFGGTNTSGQILSKQILCHGLHRPAPKDHENLVVVRK